MADQDNEQQDIHVNGNQANVGLNLNSILREVKPGQLTYALNAQIEGFDGNSVTYQNESGNIPCFSFPQGYKVMGRLFIIEEDITVYWLANSTTGGSEIGIGNNTNCTYKTLVNQNCLNHDIRYPILKAVHKKTACGIEVYWASGNNPRRFIDIKNLPYAEVFSGTAESPCEVTVLSTIDCNRLNVQPNFSIPKIEYETVDDDGSITEGTYQFAIQYGNFKGDAYTSYYSITDGIPILDPLKVSPNFDLPTGKSIRLDISRIDTTGVFDYFNLAVIKTINNITSPELVGIYKINRDTQTVLYTGQSKVDIKITMDDIFQKYPYFDRADDLTTVQDVLVWKGLETNERISYQNIVSQIKLQWQTWKIPPASNQYKDAINSATLKGYMRDEKYALSMVFLLTNGYQSDEFPFISREATEDDLIPTLNGDVSTQGSICEDVQPLPRWKVYNTATSLGTILPSSNSSNGIAKHGSSANNDPTNNACYEGPYEYGEFAYDESTEIYECNKAIWGDLAGKPIRHFRFPDNLISNHFDDEGNVYPMGIRINTADVWNLIQASSLTDEQKSQIAGFKIVRGNRASNKSVVAKGLLYNVGEYTKQSSTYFYPNYPYNDLREDKLIKKGADSNPGSLILNNFQEVSSVKGIIGTFYDENIPAGTLINDGDIVTLEYSGTMVGSANFDFFHNNQLKIQINGMTVFSETTIHTAYESFWTIKSTVKRTSPNTATVITVLKVSGPSQQVFNGSFNLIGLDYNSNIEVVLTGGTQGNSSNDEDITAQSEKISYTTAASISASPYLNGFLGDESKARFTFHSPDTSFYQPSLGTILKLENVQSGFSQGHFVEIKNHSKYKFPSLGSYLTALGIGVAIGFASGTYGVSDQPFDGAAAFSAFSIFNDITYKLIPRKNFAYQYNSIGIYDKTYPVPNNTGNKVRRIDIGAYLSSGINSVGDEFGINNYQRESSVYLKTNSILPFPSDINGVPEDQSRVTGSQAGCAGDTATRPISSYYASIKRNNPGQYGQIGSYELVDTGFQWFFDKTTNNALANLQSVFGGDIYINRFGLKRKYPFFLDNRIGLEQPDDADISYNEVGNVGYPTYWFSTDTRQGTGGIFSLGSLFGVKLHNFDCSNGSFFYDSGKIYLFAYGIPYFFVESEVNVDYRQASNGKEGDFFPHVSGSIPDDWLQEINVSILQDNVYNYNKSFSKQNIENVFTTLPADFVPGQDCRMKYPNKAIWSDKQEDPVYYDKNSWLIYKPVSYFDFPLNYGRLISIDGVENREIIARFENKMVSYNTLLTVNAGSGLQAYLGNPTLFGSPPVDFSDTDGGYAGTQHKLFVKTENGHLSIDAKRGQIFLIPGTNPAYSRRQLTDISGTKFYTSQFFNENLEFKILRTFPTYPIDNHYNGVGLHAVYDAKYDRLIITKLDYRVIHDHLGYNAITGKFFEGDVEIQLGDPNYFCNESFTVSFDFDSGSWVSFHSYLPNFYVPGPSYFFAGLQSSLWKHNASTTLFNNFFGTQYPYILEYPFVYKVQDEIVQNIKDFTKVLKYNEDFASFVETDDIYFNRAWLYNNQQHSGNLDLVMRPKNNMRASISYPKFNADSKTILVTKSNSFYNYDTFWSVTKNTQSPSFSRNCDPTISDKALVSSNMDYGVRSFKKAPLMAKDLKVRHILDNTSQYKLISQFILAPSQVSYK